MGIRAFFISIILSSSALAIHGLESITVLENRVFATGSKTVSVPGILQENKAHDYVLNYDDSSGHAKALKLHFDHVEEGVALLNGLKVKVIDEQNGAKVEKIALAIKLVADLTHETPELKLAVQYLSGARGAAIVPLGQCQVSSESFPEAEIFGELPDWKAVRVLYPWSGFSGKAQKTWANGTVFFSSVESASRSHLIAQISVIYEEWDTQGVGRNQQIKIYLDEWMEAYSISNLERVKLSIPDVEGAVIGKPKDLVIDLHGDVPEIKIAFEVNLNGEVEERILPVSAVKIIGTESCSSLISKTKP